MIISKEPRNMDEFWTLPSWIKHKEIGLLKNDGIEKIVELNVPNKVKPNPKLNDIKDRGSFSRSGKVIPNKERKLFLG